ncbi:MAG: hypothetical protein KAI24_05070 [Planctomycetes bacterium]|nr:hypothetical protein [Planctomycetota bacterium]
MLGAGCTTRVELHPLGWAMAQPRDEQAVQSRYGGRLRRREPTPPPFVAVYFATTVDLEAAAARSTYELSGRLHRDVRGWGKFISTVFYARADEAAELAPGFPRDRVYKVLIALDDELRAYLVGAADANEPVSVSIWGQTMIGPFLDSNRIQAPVRLRDGRITLVEATGRAATRR